MKIPLVGAAIAVMIIVCGGPQARADGSGDPKAMKEEDGKWSDKEGNPTYHIAPDGTVDWYTYSGYRRYHSECHVCHGPDGEGSSYAPGLKDSLNKITYAEFMEIVVNGRKNVGTAEQSVMPAFGTNTNVICYMDDLFVYLRARANGAFGRARPARRADKPAAATQAENTCQGQ